MVVKMLLIDIKERIKIEEIWEILFQQLINNLKIPKKTFSGEELFRFGFTLQLGYLGKKDLKKAMKYYKMSSDFGNSNGMIDYGLGFEKGYLGKKDLKKAMKYYTR
jgi:hypothetical protein